MSTQFADVKPFPKAPMAAGSVQGHNKPPMDIEARAAFDAVLDGREGFRDRLASLIAASDRAVATDEESAGRCGELVKQIRAAKKFVEDAHADTKAPYLAAGRAIDAAKNEIVPGLEAAQRKVEAKQTTFIREENAKREAEARRAREAEEARRREERDRQLAEAAKSGLTCQEASRFSGETYIACGKPAERSIFMKGDGRAFNMCAACAHHSVRNRGGVDQGEATEANPPIVFEAPPPPAPEPERQVIRGDYGAAVSGQKVWLSQVEDYEVAFIAVAKNEKVREAIDKAVASMVRAGEREIAGVRIWSDVKVSNR